MKIIIKIILASLPVISSFCMATSQMVFCQTEAENCQKEGAIQLVHQFPKHFEFSDEKLTIKSGDINKTILLNQPLTYEHEDEKNITLASYFPELNWLVVREVYDGGESIGYQIIDIRHQLKTTDIAALPVLSPDSSHFINMGIDLEAGFTLNGLVIYQIGSQGEIKETYRHDDSWGVVSATWVSPTQISLTTRDYCNPEERGNLCDQKQKLEFKNQAWRLSPQ